MTTHNSQGNVGKAKWIKLFLPEISLGNLLIILTFAISVSVNWALTRRDIQDLQEDNRKFQAQLERLTDIQSSTTKNLERLNTIIEITQKQLNNRRLPL